MGEEATLWVWMGENPAGEDWNLGGAGLFTLAEAMAHYAMRLRRAGYGAVARG